MFSFWLWLLLWCCESSVHRTSMSVRRRCFSRHDSSSAIDSLEKTRRPDSRSNISRIETFSGQIFCVKHEEFDRKNRISSATVQCTRKVQRLCCKPLVDLAETISRQRIFQNRDLHLSDVWKWSTEINRSTSNNKRQESLIDWLAEHRRIERWAKNQRRTIYSSGSIDRQSTDERWTNNGREKCRLLYKTIRKCRGLSRPQRSCKFRRCAIDRSYNRRFHWECKPEWRTDQQRTDSAVECGRGNVAENSWIVCRELVD